MLLLSIPVLAKLYITLCTARKVQRCPIKHLAVIMDGNRRWAHHKKLMSSFGHRQGAETVKTLISFCLSRKIQVVSIYAFSLENYNRSPEEVDDIFNIVIDQAESTLPSLKEQGIKVRFLGAISRAPQRLQTAIKRIESETDKGANLLLNVLFFYGGRQEILHAVERIVEDVKQGTLTKAPTEEVFKSYLWTSTLPDPDLIIRTGGVQRLSNFLMYQTTYSELYFTDRLWPDLTVQDLEKAVQAYCKRTRNFGK